MPPHTGEKIEGVVLGEVLGSGANAVVYRGTDAAGEAVAVKVVPRAADPSDRTLREIEALRALQHPNVVGLRGTVTTEDSRVLFLDLVEGPTLAGLIAAYTPSDDQIDELAQGILTGVAAAHAQGIIHRDIKPSNILVDVAADSPTPRVADLGLARSLGLEGPRPTRSGAGVGTPAYMAPEQFTDARGAGPRADVYSIGAVLYELITGVPPYDTVDVVVLRERKLADAVRPITSLRPSVPVGWAAVIHRAMRPEPAERFADAGEMLGAWRASRGPTWGKQQVERIADAVPHPNSGTRTLPVVAPPDAVTRPESRNWAGVGLIVGVAGGLTGGVLLGIAATAGVVAMLEHEPANDAISTARAPVPAAPVAVGAAPDRVHDEPAAAPIAAVSDPVAVAAVVPAPVVADAPVKRVSVPQRATIEVTGADVVLINGDVTAAPGVVAPGTWMVQFADDHSNALSVTVAAGERRQIRCEPRLRTCR